MYKIPNRKKKLLTKKFLQTFNDILLEQDKDMVERIRNIDYWNFYTHIKYTNETDEALKITCEKFNVVKAIYEYYYRMASEDDNREFKNEIIRMMIELKIIQEGHKPNRIWSKEYFESSIGGARWYKSVKEYKGYNVVSYHWCYDYKDINKNQKDDNETRIPVRFEEVENYKSPLEDLLWN